jgi:hypothetical protein
MYHQNIYHQNGAALPTVFRGKYQQGMGPIIFRGQYQYGNGIGSFFQGLWRTIRPLVFPAAKAVGKELLKTGVATVGDIASGENFKVAAKRRFGEARDSLREKLENKISKMQDGSGKRKINKALAGRMLFSHNLASLRRGPARLAKKKLIRRKTKRKTKKRKTKRKKKTRKQDIFA